MDSCPGGIRHRPPSRSLACQEPVSAFRPSSATSVKLKKQTIVINGITACLMATLSAENHRFPRYFAEVVRVLVRRSKFAFDFRKSTGRDRNVARNLAMILACAR